jgi:hypothetical protein
VRIGPELDACSSALRARLIQVKGPGVVVMAFEALPCVTVMAKATGSVCEAVPHVSTCVPAQLQMPRNAAGVDADPPPGVEFEPPPQPTHAVTSSGASHTVIPG